MLTLLEMRDKRALLIEDNIALTKKAEKETRKLTADEQKEFDERKATIESLENGILIEEEKRKVDPAQIVKPVKMDVKEKRFSLMGAIRDRMEGKAFHEDYTEILTEGRNEFKKAGVVTEGHIHIPSETRSETVENRAAIVTGQTTGTTAGGYAISKDWKTVLPPLTNYLVLTKAGATYMSGLVGDVRIPTYSGTSVLWKGEVASATDGAGTWGYVDLNPKRLTAFVDVSKMFLLQDAVGAEQMLMENIAKAVAVKLESTILGVGAGSVSTSPAGLFYGTAGAYYKANKTTCSYDSVIALEKNVNINNALTGSLGYITNPYGLHKLRTTAKVSSSDSVMVSDALGFPVHVTNSAAYNVFTTTGSAGLIFGNWSDLIIGQWGGYDILVDPYTQATVGTVRLVVNCYFDAAAARSASFSAINITV